MAHRIRPSVIPLLALVWLGGCSNDAGSSAGSDGSTDTGLDTQASETGTTDEGDEDPTTGGTQSCISDAECPSGQTCGQASGECLPP
jgi:hypothetical protein